MSESTSRKRKGSDALPSSAERTTKRRMGQPVEQVQSDSVTTSNQTPGMESSKSSSLDEPVRDNVGAFYQAHHFVLNNPVFQDFTQSNSDADVMKKLADRVLEGAEHDSSARYPPPRCHENTRKTLINTIYQWFHNEQREKNLLWLSGPAGVGKSAIIQTLADSEYASKRLGAAMFFSRPNDRDDPDKVIPTLAYQLAINLPNYRSYIVEKLITNPLILNKNIREQFQQFIVEPFAIKKVYSAGDVRFMMLDGLDECRGEDAQCTIIQLISDFVLRYPTVPLVWVISSRPEDHLKQQFARPNIASSHWQLYIPIDDQEARADVEHFLRSSFADLRQQYPDATSSEWPSKEDLSQIIKAASGLFIFASTIIRFVGDPSISDPVSQLQVVLSVIDATLTPEDNPFLTLDALYTRIMSDIHPSTIRTAYQLLGHLLLRGDTLNITNPSVNRPYSLLMVSNIFGLKRNAVYSALRRLHSVLFIPPLAQAHERNIRVLHASFSDYLKDKRRSGDFAINLSDINTCLWRCYHRIKLQANQDSRRPFPDPAGIVLSWPPDISDPNNPLLLLPEMLLCDTVSFWSHFLLPDPCSCGGGRFNKLNPRGTISVDVSEWFAILKNIHWNKLASGYLWEDPTHIQIFLSWILGYSEDSRDEFEKELGKTTLLQHFALTSVDLNMAAYSQGPRITKWYYSGRHSKPSGHVVAFKPVDSLLSEVGTLKRKHPSTQVFLLGKGFTKGALFACPVDGGQGIYYIPLK